MMDAVTRFWPAEGTIDRLPDEAAALRAVEARLTAVVEGRGYREIVVPLLERDGVWSAGDAVRFVDRHGQLLGLRPDFTGSVARVVATRLKDVPDVRLSYRGTVFRDIDTTTGNRRQRQQVGFEHFGSGAVDEDIEVVRTACAALAAAVPGRVVTLSLGSAAVVQALAPAAAPEVREALDRRDKTALPTALHPLLDLHGSVDVLTEAKRRLPAATHPALVRLEAIARALDGNVVVDLAELRPWTYYTGFVFALYVDGAARALAAGGRYDELTSRFGAVRPAVGATFDVDTLLSVAVDAQPVGTAHRAGPLRVALPKGRIQKHVLKALGDPFLDASRALVIDGKDGHLRFLLVKDPDVPAYVERGAADVGIVGLDVLREETHDVLEPLALPFGRCEMCLCSRPDVDLRAIARQRTVRIASKYPALAKEALAARGLPVEVIELKGSVELSVLVDLADAIVDLVETGETLKQNGLVVIERLFESTARVIVNRAAFRSRHDAVKAFLSSLGGPGA